MPNHNDNQNSKALISTCRHCGQHFYDSPDVVGRFAKHLLTDHADTHGRGHDGTERRLSPEEIDRICFGPL